MKKIAFYGVSACLSLSLFAIVSPLQATNFEGKEEEYMKKCASATLSNSDKDVCTEFNNYLKDKNDELKDNISTVKTDIATTESDIKTVEKTLADLNDDIKTKENEIKYLDDSIAVLQTSIDEKDEIVRNRMYEMQSYVNSNSFIDYVFGASSFADMMSRMDNVEELTDYDKELMVSLHNDKVLIEEQRKTAATAKTNLENQRTTHDNLHTQYIKLLNDKNDLLKDQEGASAQLEEYSDGVSQALNDLAERSKQSEITGGVNITGDSELGKAIAQAALTQRGKPYTWGATGPNTYDCSGLVYWAFNQAGKSIGRTTAQGYSQYGVGISLSEAQAGDVVTFFGYGYVCHIGIIIDNNGTVVHAAGQANEINGQWGGTVRVNNVYDVGLTIHNVRRMY